VNICQNNRKNYTVSLWERVAFVDDHEVVELKSGIVAAALPINIHSISPPVNNANIIGVILLGQVCQHTLLDVSIRHEFVVVNISITVRRAVVTDVAIWSHLRRSVNFEYEKVRLGSAV